LLGPPAYEKTPVWSVLSAMFLHAGWLHLLGNLLFLYVFGNNVEDRFGHVGFLAFYLGAGYVASYGFALGFPDTVTPMVGACGAAGRVPAARPAGLAGAGRVVRAAVPLLDRLRRRRRDRRLPRPRGRVRLRLPRRAALAPAPPAPAPRPPTSAILGLGWRISRARGTCSPPEVQDRRGGSVGRRGGEEGGSVGWVLGGAQLVRVGERGAAQRRLRVHP